MFDTKGQMTAAMVVTCTVLGLIFIAHMAAAVDQFAPANSLSAELAAKYPDAYNAIGGNTGGQINPGGGAYSIAMGVVTAGIAAAFVAVSVHAQNLEVFNPFRQL